MLKTMKFIKKLIKFFAILFIIFLALPLVYIFQFFDKNFYKDLITQNVETYSDYKLSLPIEFICIS